MLLCRFECHAVESRCDCLGMVNEKLRNLVMLDQCRPTFPLAANDQEGVQLPTVHLLNEIESDVPGRFVVWIASKEVSDRSRHFGFHLPFLGSSAGSSPTLTMSLCSLSRLRIALCSSS